jgi:dihydrofolate reductase
MTDPRWDNSQVLRGPLTAEVAALKEKHGGDIVVTGSLDLVHQLVRTGLVDEYQLFVYPIVLGTGARLFRGSREHRGAPADRVQDLSPGHHPARQAKRRLGVNSGAVGLARN